MLARLEMKLKCEEELNYQMSSLFHGVLMELLPKEYADYLHLSQLHPYTQHLEYKEKNWYWVVCCLNKETTKTIIQDTLWNTEKIEIKKRDMEIFIGQKKYDEVSYRELMEEFYEKDANRYIQLHFISPTAFKQQGKYVFYPDLRCIFQSLMNKYDVAVQEETMLDRDTLEQLCDAVQVIRYDLKSTSFPMEGIKIPAFIGKITIKMNGTQTMANFANMLFRFGEYAGVGIKTAIGMGYIKMTEERGRK